MSKWLVRYSPCNTAIPTPAASLPLITQRWKTARALDEPSDTHFPHTRFVSMTHQMHVPLPCVPTLGWRDPTHGKPLPPHQAPGAAPLPSSTHTRPDAAPVCLTLPTPSHVR